MVLDKMGGLIVQTEPKLSQAWGEEEENKVIVRIDKKKLGRDRILCQKHLKP